MVPRLDAKMIRLIGYSARPAGGVAAAPAVPGAVMSVMRHLSFRKSTALKSVIEELHLNRELIRSIACARVDVRVGELRIEVVAVRIPREAELLAVVVRTLARFRVEILFLETDPRHHLRG